MDIKKAQKDIAEKFLELRQVQYTYMHSPNEQNWEKVSVIQTSLDTKVQDLLRHFNECGKRNTFCIEYGLMRLEQIHVNYFTNRAKRKLNWLETEARKILNNRESNLNNYHLN